jgi:IS5 family transposase
MRGYHRQAVYSGSAWKGEAAVLSREGSQGISEDGEEEEQEKIKLRSAIGQQLRYVNRNLKKIRKLLFELPENPLWDTD